MGVQNKNGEAIFDKTIFGGYDVEQVDEFVQESRNMLQELKNENETLTKKLQILADKIDEYNQTKEQIERTLDEARISAADIIAVARHEVEQIKASVKQQNILEASDKNAQATNIEYKRLDEIRRLRKEFCSSLIEQYKQQINTLENDLNLELEQVSTENNDNKVFVVIKEKIVSEKNIAENTQNSKQVVSEESPYKKSDNNLQLTQEIAFVISGTENESESEPNETNDIKINTYQSEALITERQQKVNNPEDQKKTNSETIEISNKDERPIQPEQVLSYEEYMEKILGTNSPTVQTSPKYELRDDINRIANQPEKKKTKRSFILKIKQMINEIVNEEEDEFDYEENKKENKS